MLDRVTNILEYKFASIPRYGLLTTIVSALLKEFMRNIEKEYERKKRGNNQSL